MFMSQVICFENVIFEYENKEDLHKLSSCGGREALVSLTNRANTSIFK